MEPPSYPVTPLDTELLLQHLAALERRIVRLEQQTLAAYWSRLLLRLRSH